MLAVCRVFTPVCFRYAEGKREREKEKERERERKRVIEKETDIRRQRWRGAHVGKPDALESLPCGRFAG